MPPQIGCGLCWDGGRFLRSLGKVCQLTRKLTTAGITRTASENASAASIAQRRDLTLVETPPAAPPQKQAIDRGPPDLETLRDLGGHQSPRP